MADLVSCDRLSAADISRLEESASQLPPFLFRAFAIEGSRGINNENEMRPIPSRSFPRRTIFARSCGEVRMMLRSHLLWEYWNESDFISWSSSILWVLEHAARMHTYERKANVYIAIMDTRLIQDMALFPVTLLMDVYGIPARDDENARKLRSEFYTAEYLFYGPLGNAGTYPLYRSVPWERICRADLRNVLSHFSDRASNDKGLFFRIQAHRSNLERQGMIADSQDILPAFVLLGGLFGNEFQVVMTIALLTLLCGQQTPPAIDLRRDLERLRLPRPLNPHTIIQFNFQANIDAGLTEVVRMYRRLRDVLTPSLQEELAIGVNNLNIDE